MTGSLLGSASPPVLQRSEFLTPDLQSHGNLKPTLCLQLAGKETKPTFAVAARFDPVSCLHGDPIKSTYRANEILYIFFKNPLPHMYNSFNDELIARHTSFLPHPLLHHSTYKRISPSWLFTHEQTAKMQLDRCGGTHI